MASLKGKTAVVTGASSGIGKAIALTLAREGAVVFLTGRDHARTHATADEIMAAGGKAVAEAFDVTDIARLQSFIAKAATVNDGLHITVNAAGLEFPGQILKGDPARWKEVLDTNVVAVAVGSQAAVKAMRETKSEGHIVTISSIASKRAEGGMYSASKIAVNFVMATLRQELEDEPIRVVTIMPGAVGTNFARNFPAEFVNGFAKAAGIHAEVKQGDVLPDAVFDTLNERAAAILAKPQDIADAVLYAINQPITLNINEITVRPGKSLALPND